MKKLYFIIIFILIHTAIFAQKLTILDYFEKLPEEMRLFYKIENAEGEWISRSTARYEIKPTVDIINGFIEIQDEGTGGGLTILQVVLYRKKDGTGLIGISSYNGDGVSEKCTINFLEYNNNEWINVTSEVFPVLNYQTFVNPNYTVPDFPEDYYEMSAIRYKLPQYGTTIEAELIAGGLSLICNGYTDALTADKESVCDFISNINKIPVKIFWDKNKRKFYKK